MGKRTGSETVVARPKKRGKLYEIHNKMFGNRDDTRRLKRSKSL